MTEGELASLMADYQRGDAAAFDSLYRALRPRLAGYLVFLSRDRRRLDDLLQETFLQIHRSRGTYRPGRPVVPWAFAIARHVFLAEARQFGRRQRHEAVLTESPPEIRVLAEAEGLADRDRLQQALRRLPADQTEAMMLNQVWGFTFAEIGAMLGVSSVTAKVRSFRGIRRLREILGTDR